MNVSETNGFAISVSVKTYKINRKHNCLIYFLSWECCSEKYDGKTTGNIRYM